jgi:NAD-dependent SIR2 family protein deacetylase
VFKSDPNRWCLEKFTTPDLLGDLEQAKPNAGHYALTEVEDRGILKRMITQMLMGFIRGRVRANCSSIMVAF